MNLRGITPADFSYKAACVQCLLSPIAVVGSVNSRGITAQSVSERLDKIEARRAAAIRLLRHPRLGLDEVLRRREE